MRPSIALTAETRRLAWAFAAAGLLCVGLGIVTGRERAWSALFVGSYILVGLGLGGPLFLAMHRLSGGGWATALRRIPESMFALLPVGGLGMVLVLVVHPQMYAWTHPDPGLAHLMYGFKGLWLERNFFLVRSGLYLLGWWWLGRNVVASARLLGDEGGEDAYRTHGRHSAVFVVFFALSFSLASFDWVMSVEPSWYSTIFALYCFAGLFLSFLSLMTLLAVWLQHRGPFRSVLNGEHLHDLGKLMLGFSTFWAYMWFSQYMLIWYSNLPEEVGYYVLRQHGAWNSVFYLGLALNWAIPFAVLLPKQAKRSPSVMAKVAGVFLVGRWLDVHLLVVPALVGPLALPFSIWDVGAVVAVLGIVSLVLTRVLGESQLVPSRDPLLAQSLHYHS